MTEQPHFTFHFMHWRRKWQSTPVFWRIPGTEEPSGLPSMRLHRVGHNWSDLAAASAAAAAGGSMVKNPPANAGDVGLISGSGRTAGEGNGSPLQYSCLENSMDREAWQATVYRVTKSWTRPSTHAHTHTTATTTTTPKLWTQKERKIFWNRQL